MKEAKFVVTIDGPHDLTGFRFEKLVQRTLAKLGYDVRIWVETEYK